MFVNVLLIFFFRSRESELYNGIVCTSTGRFRSVIKEGLRSSNLSSGHFACTIDEEFTASRYAVTVDNIKIASTTDSVLATQVLLASYYVYNMAYPPRGRAALTFIQKCLANVQDETPYMAKLNTFLSQVYTFSQGKKFYVHILV